jgi:cell division protein FtsQ
MSTVAVDPRIRARRASVARDAGRRRLRRVTWVAGVLALVGVAYVVTLTPVLDVQEITVRGDGHTAADAVSEAAGVTTGDPLAWFDTRDAAEAVAALPWVDEATVSRHWSGSVTIEITERVAVAALPAADGAWLLADGSGRVLDRVDAQPTEVPLVEGLDVAHPGQHLTDADDRETLRLAAAVPPSLRPEVATVTGGGDELGLTLRAGGTVLLGGTEDAAAKLDAAAAVLATVASGCVDRLDVSVASAPALISVPGCAP